MATTITFNSPTDDEKKPIIQTHVEQQSLLQAPTKIFKPFPTTIIQSIEADRRQRQISSSHSSTDFLTVKQSSIDTTDDDLDENNQPTTTNQNLQRSKSSATRRQTPLDVRVTLYPDENVHIHSSLTSSQLTVSKTPSKTELRGSDPSFLDSKISKQNRGDNLRRALFEHRFGRRIHSSFSSSTTLRSLSRRRSTQNLTTRPSAHSSKTRRRAYHLPRNSKWHIVRHRLHDIAMMSENYARMKLVEQDLRWQTLRERIRTQVLDMREMSLLRQQDDGLISNKKTRKTTRFDLKAIPINEMVHVERDGRVYSMTTRDLVLGRLLGEDVQLDAFSQLDARRQFKVQQHLLKQQEGRTRLKKHIAFSFCLCNLSFIVLMFASMFIFAMKTILELRTREFL